MPCLRIWKNVDNHRLADGYDTESRVLDDSMSEQEFLQWSQCEGSHAGLWWLFGASQASRPDWLMRLPLADGTGNLVLQGQSKRVQPPDRRHLTGELPHAFPASAQLPKLQPCY